MISLILRTATKFLLPLLLLFSIFLVMRGHNEPGGGFAGGLVAAAGFALYALSTNVQAARRALQIDTHTLIGSGLLLAVATGVLPLLLGQEFLSGQWISLEVFAFGVIEIGTPLLFDIGVYLVVLGVALMIIFTLAEE